jgi:CHAT domain-containing protein
MLLSLTFPVGIAESKTQGQGYKGLNDAGAREQQDTAKLTKALFPSLHLAQVQTPNERLAEADRLFQQGLQYSRSSQFQEAIPYLQKASNIYQEIGDNLKLANSLNELGIAYFSRGQYKKAIEYHEQSLAISRDIKNRELEAKSLNGLGNAYSFLRQLQKAIEYHEQSLTIAREIKNRELEAKSFNGLGNAYLYLKQEQKAIELYQKTLALAKEIGDKQLEAKSLNNLGGAFNNLKQYQKAIEFFERSLAITREVKDRRIEAITLYNLGRIYDFVGGYQKAIEMLKPALAIYREIGHREGEMECLIHLGVVYRHLEQYQKAIEFNQQSLAIAGELGDRYTQAASFGNLGVSNFFLGEYQKAIEFHQQALAIYREIGHREGEGLTLGNLGLAYNSLGEYQKAIEFHQQSLDIARKLGDILREGNALNNIGQTYNRLERYADASNALMEAINVYESLRPGLADTNKISILDTYARSYRLLQTTLVAQNKINNALEIAERGRARAFVELLASKLFNKPNNQVNIKPPSVEEIKKIAQQQDATLVEYSLNESKLYIWVIKPTGEISFKQVDSKLLNTSLTDLVISSRNAIGVRGRNTLEISFEPGQDQTQRLQQLHKLLIEPIAQFLPTNPNERVVFIPQNELFLVPFSALQDPSGKYLIEKHTILTAPAIQALQLTREKRLRLGNREWRVGSGNVVVVGNPAMPSVTAQLGEPPQKLSNLPGAEKEAITIAQLLGIKALIGNQATKAAILPKLSKARMIHLATHGLLEDFKGMGVPGAIALAPDGTGDFNDGLLTASEILDMNLNAELVILSACDTGRGRITGDGVIGLSRSFITAGVPSVIVSLWSVPDAPTASLMTQFYQNLKQNPDKAQALRQAMLTTMGTHPNPKDWAAFTLIGEAQ